MFKRKTIRSRVMSVIEERLGNAQEKHDERCDTLESEFGTTVATLREQVEKQKEEHAQSIVKEIVG